MKLLLSSKTIGKQRPPFSDPENHKKNCRIAALRRIAKNGIAGCEDVGSRTWFKKYNKETNSDFKPKTFWKWGYRADGYDENKHIWIEYDTNYHKRQTYKQKDLIRQNNIIKYFEGLGEPLVEFKRVLAYRDEEIKTVYRGYGYA